MLRDILLAPFSALLLILAYPAFDISFLAWIALVPLFLAIMGKAPINGLLLSLLCAVTFFAGIFYYTLEVASYSLLHHLILSLCFGSYLACIGLCVSFISKRHGATLALFAAPFVWISFEYIKSNFFFLAFPWGLLGHSQYQNPAIIQIASLTGTYGISFLIVLVNAAVAAMILPVLSRLRWSKPYLLDQFPSPRGRRALLLTAALAVFAALLYGHITLSGTISGNGFKVSVAQGNIEQKAKWKPSHARYIMETYARLTDEASKNRPAIIVWPEAATPRAITRDRRLYSQVRHIAERAGTNLLLGSSSHQKFKTGQGQKVRFYNSAFLINPEKGDKHQRYDKIRLLPFGEYLPLKGTIPWSWINVPNMASYTPGKEHTVFECPHFRFGVTICWESLFPDLVRQFVKDGAQFMVNITNEAWFKKTAAPYQFLSMNIFRAVENRVFVVRCANTGISCFIDPYGRVFGRVKNARGRDIFVRGVLTRTVIPMDCQTIYTRYGDWLVWLSMLCSAGFLITAFLRRKPKV